MEGRRGGRGRFSGVCERQQETETMWKFDQRVGWMVGVSQRVVDSRETEQ